MSNLSPTGWLLRFMLTIAFSSLASYLLLGGEFDPASPELLTTLGAVVATLGYLFLSAPSPSGSGRARDLLLGSLLSALCLVLLLATPPFGPAAFEKLLPLTAAVFLLAFLLGSLARYFTGAAGNPATPLFMVLLVTGLITGAPLWLGPLMEQHLPEPVAINTLIAASPLSYLAVIADHDYLRSTWFYQHTPLGSLRYRYPDGALLSTVYLLTGLLFLYLGRRPKKIRPSPPSEQSLPEEINTQ